MARGSTALYGKPLFPKQLDGGDPRGFTQTMRIIKSQSH